MDASFEALRVQLKADVAAVSSLKGVLDLKVKYLGSKSNVQALMKNLRDLPAEQRPEYGQKVNLLKAEFEKKLTELEAFWVAKQESAQLENEKIDISLPGRRRNAGRKHPAVGMLDRMIDILAQMGFSVQYGPEVDTDHYNFGALNFGPDHPARDMQDTFWIDDNYLLRTHTSNIQVRVMEANRPPIRVIAPGRCYRNESISNRSHVVFYQLEAIYVDVGVTFADLLATLEDFLRKLFGPKVKARFRPSYFPFVEPGVEVDVSCLLCDQKGCSMCKRTGWLEILGAGMIHPEVLKAGGIDPESYSGFAWGMGPERICNLLHGVTDIRQYTENDVRFLQQF